MIPLTVTLNLDINPWTDLVALAADGELPLGQLVRVGVLPQGMASGRASLTMVGQLPDGRLVALQTSLRNFQAAAAAVNASPVAQMEDL